MTTPSPERFRTADRCSRSIVALTRYASGGGFASRASHSLAFRRFFAAPATTSMTAPPDNENRDPDPPVFPLQRGVAAELLDEQRLPSPASRRLSFIPCFESAKSA